MNKDKLLFIVLGPTCVGKTSISIELAKSLDAEIFSCDSRQVYKELNIGVARPTEEELSLIKHHLIAHVSIQDHYSISKYEVDAIAALDEYFKSNNIAIMCGGSGLYIDAICNGVDEMPDHDPEIRSELNEIYKQQGIETLRYELKEIDPAYYQQVDLKNPQRIIRAIETYRLTGIPFSDFRKRKIPDRKFKIIKIGIELDRNELYRKINERVDIMLNNGLEIEARNLHNYKSCTALKTIGYKEFFQYFENKQDYQKTIEDIKQHTRNYARRQLTWFRRYKDIQWFNNNEINNIKQLINSQT